MEVVHWSNKLWDTFLKGKQRYFIKNMIEKIIRPSTYPSIWLMKIYENPFLRITIIKNQVENWHKKKSHHHHFSPHCHPHDFYGDGLKHTKKWWSYREWWWWKAVVNCKNSQILASSAIITIHHGFTFIFTSMRGCKK